MPLFSNNTSNSEPSGPPPREPVWKEAFRDVSQATIVPHETEGNRASFILKLELSAIGKVTSHSDESEVRASLTIPVDERDAPAFLRLLGKRILLRELRTRNSLERESLEAEVVRLRNELEVAAKREEILRSNFHALVEGTRKAP